LDDLSGGFLQADIIPAPEPVSDKKIPVSADEDLSTMHTTLFVVAGAPLLLPEAIPAAILRLLRRQKKIGGSQ
jgi:hypothetical protein